MSLARGLSGPYLSGPPLRARSRWAGGLAACLACALSIPTVVEAQERLPAPIVPGTTLPAIDVSPRGAFLRALVVPGWGHVVIGSYTRGGFYFATQTATIYTLLRTRSRVSDAQDRIRFHEGSIRERLAREGVMDAAVVQATLDDDENLLALEELLDARQEQHQDLVAVGLFFWLVSGADAYVSAHLARFPQPLELDARPVGDGRMEVGLRLRLPN